MTDALLIFIPMILSTLFAFPVCMYCEKKGIVDVVSKRSSHKKTTARGGGIIFIIPTVLFSFLWFAWHGHTLPKADFILAILIGSPLIALLGWADDKKELPVFTRLCTQFFIVGVMVYFMPPVFESVLGFWGAKALVFFAWIWFINLYNFMDGLNTYASMQAIFLSIVLSFFMADIKPVLLVLAGSVLGFIRVNKTPAKIFMGDTGSLYLGTLLGGIMFLLLTESARDWFVPLLTLTMLFTFDATFTLFKRIAQKKAPWKAHKEFMFHRANVIGFTHEQITMRGLFINIFLLILMFAQIITGLQIPLIIMALMAMTAINRYIRYLENK